MAITETSLRKPAARRAGTAGPDRATVVMLSLAAFLVLLALLAWQLRASASTPRARAVITVRKIYETRVIDTIVGGSGRSSVTQSVSSSGASYTPVAAPTTRTS